MENIVKQNPQAEMQLVKKRVKRKKILTSTVYYVCGALLGCRLADDVLA